MLANLFKLFALDFGQVIIKPVISFLFLLPFLTSDLLAQSGQLPPDIIKDFQYTKPKKELTGRLAFSAKIGAWQRIFVIDLKSGTFTPLVTGPGNNFYPSWSPDGQSLVFVSDRDGNQEIYTVKWYGAELTRLTNNTEEDSNPDWGSDLNLITYSTASKDRTNIFQLNLNDKQPTKITDFEGRDTTPRISPDGQRIAYSTNRFWPGWDICVFDMASKKESCPLFGTTSHCRPYWDKAGDRLLYATGDGRNINIGLFDNRSNKKENLTQLPKREYDPVWGPDETSVFFVAESDKDNHFDIYLKLLEDKHPVKLIKSPYSIRYLSWDSRSTLELEALRIREAHKIATQKNN